MDSYNRPSSSRNIHAPTDKQKQTDEVDAGCLNMAVDQQKKIDSTRGALTPKTSCKRKLFAENDQSKQRSQITITQMDSEKNQRGKDSLSYKLSSLLPGHPAVLEYSKYRRLLKQQTGDRTLRQSYDVALAKLQLAVSRRHSELRKNNEKTFLKQYAEDLMNYWGMYFY
uniref:Uncharacterized protein LOC111100746 n=1 Tax=Crassostrea virginica TaxID=6565 RepID=A0A8B8ABJ0_CRAVI|nr:uncharacterized protein LOC111100746 [Crassostrea virginica]